MSATPTWFLPPCPRCSVPRANLFERPVWRHAHRTSVARGKKCFFWIGCVHAQPLHAGSVVEEDDEEIQKVEAAWSTRRVEIFVEMTGNDGWTPASRANLARALDLTIPPARPASQEHRTIETK